MEVVAGDGGTLACAREIDDGAATGVCDLVCLAFSDIDNHGGYGRESVNNREEEREEERRGDSGLEIAAYMLLYSTQRRGV